MVMIQNLLYQGRASRPLFFTSLFGGRFWTLLLCLLLGLFAQCSGGGGGGESGGSPSPSPSPGPGPSPGGPAGLPGCDPDPRCAGLAMGIVTDFHAGDGAATGNGTTTGPYLICTYEQLKNITNPPRAGMPSADYLTNQYYVLGDNIDASPSWSQGTGGCTAYNGSNSAAADCKGWAPIGNGSYNFKGSFDGRACIISKLYINISSAEQYIYAGLFGWVDSDSSSTPPFNSLINNVKLTELSVTTSSTYTWNINKPLLCWRACGLSKG